MTFRMYETSMIPGGGPVRLKTSKELGLRIRDRRLQLGWSQAELAARIGMSRQWVMSLEKGAAGAALGTVLRTLSALGLALDVSEPHWRSQGNASMGVREEGVPYEQIRAFVDSVGSRVVLRDSDDRRPPRTPLRAARRK